MLLHTFSTLLAKLNPTGDTPQNFKRSLGRSLTVWAVLALVSLVAFLLVKYALANWLGVAKHADLAAILWLLPTTVFIEPGYHLLMARFGKTTLTPLRTPLHNLWPAQHRTVEMRGVVLHIARALWGLVFFVAVGVTLIGLQATYEKSIVPLAATPNLDVFRVTLKQAEALAQIGLPIQTFGILLVGIRYLFIAALASSGLFIFWQRSNHLVAYLLSLFLVVFAVTVGVPQDSLITRYPFLYHLAETLQAIATALLTLILFIFPNGRLTPEWVRRLVLPWLITAAIWACLPAAPFNINYSETWDSTLALSVAHNTLWVGLGFASMIHRYFKIASPTERDQMRLVLKTWLGGFVIGNIRVVVPAATFALGIQVDGWLRLLWTFGFFALFGVAFVVCGLAFVVSVFQHQTWETQKLRRTTVYNAMLGLVLFATAVCVALLGWMVFTAITDNPLITQLAALIIALIPAALVFGLLQKVLNGHFHRQRIDANQALITFAHDLRPETNPDFVHAALLDRCLTLLQASYGAILVYTDTDTPRILAKRGFTTQTRQHLENPAGELATRYFPLILMVNATPKILLALGPHLSEQDYHAAEHSLVQGLIQCVHDWESHRERTLLAQQITVHHHSPTGQAEALAQAWLAAPESMLLNVDALATQASADSDAALSSVLEALPLAAAHLGSPALRTLAEGYRLLCHGRETPEVIGSGLRTVIGALSQSQGRSWQQADATIAICRTLLRWLAPESLTQIADSREEARALYGQMAAQDDNAIPLAAALGALRPVWQAILASEEPAHVRQRLSGLDEALSQINRLQLATLPGPAHIVARHVVASWQALITQARQTLQAVASLHLHVTSHRAVIHDHDHVITLATEIQNIGLGKASQVRLEWLGAGERDIDIALIEHTHLPGELDAGASISVLSRIGLSKQIDTQTLHLRARLRYQDGTDQPRSHDFEAVIDVFHAPKYDQRIGNPYRIGTPLPAESHLFMGREDDMAWLAQTLALGHNHIVLVGQTRMGKTSLLKQLQTQLSHQFAPIFLDVQRLGIDGAINAGAGLSNFLLDIALEICASLNLAAPDATLFEQRPMQTFEREFLPDVLQALGNRKLLLLFDESEELESRVLRGKLDDAVFAWLRHLMQHHPRLVFVFVGAHPLDNLNANRWLVSLNAAQMRLGPLSHRKAVQLITQPVEDQLVFDTLAIDHLLQLASGHPYFVQVMCRVLVDLANLERRTYVLADHIELALPRALELSAGQLVDIWNESTPQEQRLLRAISQQVSGAGWIAQASLISTVWHDQTSDASAALQRLVRRNILKLRQHTSADSADNADVGWELGIMGRWLQLG